MPLMGFAGIFWRKLNEYWSLSHYLSLKWRDNGYSFSKAVKSHRLFLSDMKNSYLKQKRHAVKVPSGVPFNLDYSRSD